MVEHSDRTNISTSSAHVSLLVPLAFIGDVPDHTAISATMLGSQMGMKGLCMTVIVVLFIITVFIHILTAFIFTFSGFIFHLADAFIQRDLQMRRIEAIRTNKRAITRLS